MIQNPPRPTRRPKRLDDKAGFALVITLSLMILLTLLAVGLLSLSTIALRSSSQSGEMAVARGNARLALMLAIGELQKSIGPDQRITATSEILNANPAKPRLMGVWKSWNYNPSDSNLDYDGTKQSNFLTWLVSDKDRESARKREYPTDAPKGDTIKLVGGNSLGNPNPAPADTVVAGKVPISENGKVRGTFAWHVSDESVKARINNYRDPAQNQTPWQKRALLAGHRADPSLITAKDSSDLSFMPTDENAAKYKTAIETSAKITDLYQIDLLTQDRKIAKFRNHVTPYSTGLLTNVREGGLMQDLSSVFGTPSTMPAPYEGKTLYASTHKITGPTDPYWSTLKSYYDIYREPSITGNDPILSMAPREAVALNQTTPPRAFYPAPVIQKIELLFSFVVRESHGPWSASSTGRPELTRMGHLLYAPIITLHNPYNVSLKFDQLDLDIKGIPIGFNFIVNRQPQNNKLVSFNELFVSGAVRKEKSFLLSISDWPSTSSSSPSPITMKPGQTLVCGPFIDGSAFFGSNGNAAANVFFDYRNDLTGSGNKRAKCKPGFLGRQVSYDIDWLTLPEHASGFSTDGNRGTLIIQPRDSIVIEWGIQPNTGIIRDKMTVEATLFNGNRGRGVAIGGLEFGYDTRALAKYYSGVKRFPDPMSVPSSFTAEELYEPNSKPIKDQTKVKSFALISAYARTANGGVYDNGTRDKIPNGQNLQLDGRLAGRPFLHHNPARTPTVIDLKNDLPGRYSHELNVQPLPGNVDDLINIDPINRGYSITSNRVIRGIKSGSYLELPTGPMQTIADFRRSNALTGPLLPLFVQPVSNSYASPLISTNKVSQPGVVAYTLLDHSALANHALYDRFYFSTFANYGNKPVESVFNDFMENSQPLISQAFEPYLPDGKTIDSAKAELFANGRSSASAYQNAAEYQLIRGPFNVNSTDVEAWKAVIGSMGKSAVQILWAASGSTEGRTSARYPILPMSLVNGGAVDSFNAAADAPKIDTKLTNDFNGYQDLDTYKIQTLAERIVDEVRKRGPFLSMSEFVNRRIGPESELTLAGALQAAIDQSNLNTEFLKGNVSDVRAADVADRSLYGFSSATPSTGNPAAGAPGWISQGDLMRILEPRATVRSDTFVIRVCGEAHDATGKVTARAYAEGVVQRYPEYVNSADRPSTNVWDPNEKNAAPDNVLFGRRLSLVSFRWLSEVEI